MDISDLSNLFAYVRKPQRPSRWIGEPRVVDVQGYLFTPPLRTAKLPAKSRPRACHCVGQDNANANRTRSMRVYFLLPSWQPGIEAGLA